MGIRKNLNTNHVLISVFDKKKLSYLCKNLKKFKYKFISTGSTYKEIRRLGFDCIELSKITKFRELFDGRVKTLNPKVFGSILHIRDNKKHSKEYKYLNMPLINIVVVNFYPFKKTTDNKDENKIIEMIDIGGPSLIRAASKNYKYVTSISSESDYKNLIENLKINDGSTDIIFRKKMASKSFNIVKKYDETICAWFNKKEKNIKKSNLRYGENYHQKSYLLENKKNPIFNLQIHGKKISYNNIIDIDNGFKCLSEFKEPTCVIIKHTNPCGVASSTNIKSAYNKAYQSDEVSAFGGIVLLNRKLNVDLAKQIKNKFFEVIAASSFDKESIKLLKNRKNLILLKLNKIKFDNSEFRSTIFGNIYQDIDKAKINKNFIKLVSMKKCSENELKDLIFSIKVVKHLKSNGIVLVKNKQTIGLGIGQTSRIDSLKIALSRMKLKFKDKKFVCASDGFFPFVDSIELLERNNCKVIAQPFGSINDKKIINYSNKKQIALYFTKNRLFKH